MKKQISILALGTVAALTLASCGGNKTAESTYRTYYAEDYETLNYLVSSKQRDSEFFADCVDGLLETDRLGNIVPCLAESYTTKVNSDGNTEWTFKIRDTSWVKSDGSVYAKVKAQDWVDAAQYILNPNNNSGTVNLWATFIVGAEDYYDSLADEDTKNDLDFSTVGVKATSDDTLVYTVIGEQAYFDSALTYAAFFPVNGDYLQEEGTSFGLNKDEILYNGGYIMEANVKGSYTDMKKNEKYWDAEHVYVDNVHYAYVSATTYSTARELYEQGEIDGFSVNAKDAEGFKKYVTGEDGTGTVENPVTDTCYIGKAVGTGVYAAAFNFDRLHGGTVEGNESTMFNYSTHTTASYANTQKAILNANFRKMFVYGFDFTSYNQIYSGDGLGLTYQCKGWTIPQLCSANGHDYSYYFAAEYAKNNGLTDIDDTQTQLYNDATKDIVYSEDKAKAFALAAYTELSAQGVTFPVKIETYGDQDAEYQAWCEEYCKAFQDAMTIEVGGKKIQLIDFVVYQPKSDAEVEDCFYYSQYDFTLSTGWGADYSDPNTFMNCYINGGDAVSTLGLEYADGEDDTLADTVLGKITKMVHDANAIADPNKKQERYEAFAAAEYEMIYNEAIIIPYYWASATRVYISKVMPYTSLRCSSGISDSKHKYMVMSDSVVTQAQYKALKAAYQEGTVAAIDAVVAKIQNGEIK